MRAQMTCTLPTLTRAKHFAVFGAEVVNLTSSQVTPHIHMHICIHMRICIHVYMHSREGGGAHEQPRWHSGDIIDAQLTLHIYIHMYMHMYIHMPCYIYMYQSSYICVHIPAGHL